MVDPPPPFRMLTFLSKYFGHFVWFKGGTTPNSPKIHIWLESGCDLQGWSGMSSIFNRVENSILIFSAFLTWHVCPTSLFLSFMSIDSHTTWRFPFHAAGTPRFIQKCGGKNLFRSTIFWLNFCYSDKIQSQICYLHANFYQTQVSLVWSMGLVVSK